MEIIIVAALDENNGIGKNGDQPAYISSDLKRFKQLTTGHSIVMGRKTFDALPKKPLPQRRNIVLTRNKKLNFPNCNVATSPQEIAKIVDKKEKIFIIGGGEIYKHFLPFASQLIITRIHHKFTGIDTWFPKIDTSKWIMKEDGPFKDEKNGLHYSYQTFNRV
ncbi:dihydrofolate reductase [Marinilabiliaceae bacterium ANBcel2]|nr:dihydrofolate reductase [Marinilabiliaceae bacterium ANBcel2]